MICFKNPFEAKSIILSYMNIVNGNIPKIENKNVSNELIELIYKILKVNHYKDLKLRKL